MGRAGRLEGRAGSGEGSPSSKVSGFVMGWPGAGTHGSFVSETAEPGLGGSGDGASSG